MLRVHRFRHLALPGTSPLRLLATCCVVLGMLGSMRSAARAGDDPALSARAAQDPAVAGADQGPAAVNGLYPLWEQTGVLHARGAGQIGYNHAQLGLGRLQIGTQPFLNLTKTYNLQLKLALLATGPARLALTAGVYRFPSAAQSKTIGELHRTAFQNYRPVEVVPVALAHSFAAGRLDVHSALTAMPRHAGHPDDGPSWVVSLGVATMAELRVSPAWSARLHGGLWGLGVERQAHVGLSFAYRGEVLLLEGGYARQASLTGESQGKYLRDGALVFR